jgi:hypothetical protein
MLTTSANSTARARLCTACQYDAGDPAGDKCFNTAAG